MNIRLTAVLLVIGSTVLAQNNGPLATSLAPFSAGQPVTIRITSDTSLRDYTNITLKWDLKVNGSVRQKGALTGLPLFPKKPALVHLPVRVPKDAVEELYLDLYYYYHQRPAGNGPTANHPPANRTATRPSSGHIPAPDRAPAAPLSEAHLLLHPWTGSQLPIRPAGELTFTDSNGIFTIQSPAALLRFDKQTGWLQSYTAGDCQLIEDTPGCKPHLWLDSTAPAFSPARAAASPDWAAANLSPHLQLFSTSTGSQLVIVRTEYTLPETSCLLHLSYTINATGEALIEQSLEADSTRQGQHLPCFGMYWRLPAGFDSLSAYGPRPDTPEPSLYRLGVTGTISCDSIRWLSITRPDGKGLRLTADSTLLTIQTQPSAPRIFIDAPAQPYQLPYASYRYAFKLSPIAPPSSPSSPSSPKAIQPRRTPYH